MKLTTRLRYGTRALLDLSIHQGEGPVSLKDIAQRQQIPKHYLERLISSLIAADIVQSTRGPKGGVALTRSPHQIRMSEVYQLFEGSTALVECVDNPKVCRRFKTCGISETWAEMKMAMDEILESTTLRDMVERQREKDSLKEAMYYI